MNPHLKSTMAAARSALTATPTSVPTAVKVGVDLGTAYTVVMVTDADDRPLAGATVFADVVRDGVVWDFAGAQQVVAGLKADLEQRLGRELRSGAVTIPPGVDPSNHRAHKYVLEGAGIECTAVVDETTAANAVLQIQDGAIVDIGGGTTGIAVLKGGEIISAVDEPSGGTHFSLVIAGALGISFEEADALKRDPESHRRLYGTVLPVMQKMSGIVADAIAGHDVQHIHLVGGSSAFTGFDEVMSNATGIATTVAPDPILTTPLGVARWAAPLVDH